MNDNQSIFCGLKGHHCAKDCPLVHAVRELRRRQAGEHPVKLPQQRSKKTGRQDMPAAPC